MFNKLILFFIPLSVQQDAELFRKFKLVVSIIIVTVIFDLNYAGITILIRMKEGTYVMLATFMLHSLLPFFIRRNIPILLVTNLYLLFGAQAIVQCIYYSGGFRSPVLPWLATTPIVALLMGGRTTGFAWMIINTIVVIVFSIYDKSGFVFPIHYSQNWENEFLTNCFTGLVLIIFFVALVFENGKNTAFKKLAENNELLAEERKRSALFQISQEIHDGVGQTLSLAKLNLHTLQMDNNNDPVRVKNTLSLISKAINDIRTISRNINDNNITNFNLMEAIQEDVKTLDKIGEYTIDFKVAGTYIKMNAQSELVLYRIVQELMNNTIKHARATSITLQLKYEPMQFQFIFSDNGIGITNPDLSGGLGIRNIRSRVKMLGGEMEITTGENQGTKVKIRIALAAEIKNQSIKTINA
jgi:signal transduction histidine kinase